MSVLVVYIHMYDAQYAEASFRVVRVVEDLFSQGLCRVAVPVFFMISGYLHFSRCDLSENKLFRIFAKKIPGLVVPFLFWNTFYLTYHTACILLLNRTDAVSNIWEYILKGIFLYGCNPAFWYVFQTIILFAMSPLLFKLLKRKWTSALCIAVFFMMYLLVEKNTKWFLLPGILYFSLGATGAIHLRRMIDWELYSENGKKYVPIFALTALILLMYYRVSIMDLSKNISALRDTVPYRLFECLIAISFWFASDIIKISTFRVRKFEKYSFIIYSVHWFAISVVNIFVNHVVPINPISRLTVYIVSPIIIIVGILAIAGLMKRFSPKLYGIVSGGRA